MENHEILFSRHFSEHINYSVSLPVEAAVYSIENYTIHQHPDLELIWVVSGIINVDTIYDNFTLKEGDVLLIDQNDFHCMTGIIGQNELLILHFSPIFVNDICGELFSYFICEWVDGNRESIDKINRIKYLLSRILILYFKGDHLKDIGKIRSTAEEIILILLNDFNMVSYYKPKQSMSVIQEARLINIVRYLKQNYREKIRLSDLSENENIETTYLSHLLKNISSFTFEEHIEFVRTAFALNLLLKTELSVNNIAFEAGFSDTKYLYKGFKKWFDRNPGSIRKIYRDKSTISCSIIKKDSESGMNLVKNLQHIHSGANKENRENEHSPDKKDYNRLLLENRKLRMENLRLNHKIRHLEDEKSG